MRRILEHAPISFEVKKHSIIDIQIGDNWELLYDKQSLFLSACRLICFFQIFFEVIVFVGFIRVYEFIT